MSVITYYFNYKPIKVKNHHHQFIDKETEAERSLPAVTKL